MNITDEMLEAAVRKATEAGVFRRHCNADERTINIQIMQSILQAALALHDGDTSAPTALPRLLMKGPATGARKRH
jgi:hypothetical protein